MENVQNCIIVDQYYCLSKACRNQTSAVYVTDLSYRNIKGTYNVIEPPIHFACSDTVACTNITMSDVELLPHEGELMDDPFCWNAYGIQETITIPPINCLQEGMPATVAESSAYGCQYRFSRILIILPVTRYEIVIYMHQFIVQRPKTIGIYLCWLHPSQGVYSLTV